MNLVTRALSGIGAGLLLLGMATSTHQSDLPNIKKELTAKNHYFGPLIRPKTISLSLEGDLTFDDIGDNKKRPYHGELLLDYFIEGTNFKDYSEKLDH